MPKGYYIRTKTWGGRKRQVIRPIGPSIAYVPLTKGLYALIDGEDAERVSGHSWCVIKAKRGWYAQARIGNKCVLLHRFLLDAPANMTVDHRDNERTLDNRVRSGQLRLATASQNAYNTRGRRGGLKGIWLNKPNSKWGATIYVDRKKICLGYFHTPEEAHSAYCEASKRYHGEFGRTA